MNQKTFEEIATRYASTHMSKELIELTLRTGKHAPYYSPSDDLLDALALMQVDAATKYKILNLIQKLFEGNKKDNFFGVVASSLENGLEVNTKLISAYADIFDYVNGKLMVEYLWEMKMISFLDVLIDKNEKNIESLFVIMKYDRLSDDDLIQYIHNRINLPLSQKKQFELAYIELTAENMSFFKIYPNQINSLLINGASLIDFVDSSNHKINQFDLITNEQIQEVITDSHELEEFYEYNEINTNIYNNIIWIDIVFTNRVKYRSQLVWISDNTDFYDLLQEIYEDVDGFHFHYNNQFVRKDLFSTYILELLVKEELKLKNSEVLSLDQLRKLEELTINVSSSFSMEDFMKDYQLLDDLKRIYFVIDGDELDSEYNYDISILSNLNPKTQISFLTCLGYKSIKGLRNLASNGRVVTVPFGFYDNADKKKNSDINFFNSSKAKLIVEEDVLEEDTEIEY